MDFIPQDYTITFAPDLETFTYTGHEIFTFSATDTIKTITLDAGDILIQSCTLKNDPKQTVIAHTDATKKAITFTFSTPLKKGTHVLDFTFSAKFSEGLSGWYKSKYMVGKKAHYLVTTDFEPADARTVFPCVDHPSYKATFTISLLIEKQLTGISNMPVLREMIQGKKKLLTFAQTPKMATYLLYLGVGKFSMYEDTYNRIPIRGITTPGKENYTKFAVDWAKQCLAFFEDYFGMKYVLPKLDLLAIPDFGPGAMENWGAITFRENLLLYYEQASSIATKQAIAEVVAHELAHQWFGNLVTMKWWNDLWLNESFATFMAYKVVDHFFPQWHTWSEYLTDMVFTGMDLDSLRSSHPIQVIVDHVDQINELFDEIAYDKGGSILRMLEEYVGKEAFRDGLRSYIATYAYQNTQGKNLWDALEKVSKKTITPLMQSYIIQQGFPHISVSQKEKKLTTSQKQFLFTPEKKAKQWAIPLVIDTGKGIQKHLFDKLTDSISLKNAPEFINMNKHYAGFYITDYDEILLKKFGNQLKKTDYTDRLGLIHDQYFLTIANRKKLQDFTKFIRTYFLNENDPSVLNYIIGKLAKIQLMTGNEEEKSLVITLAKNALKQTSYTPKPHEDPHVNFLRNSALYALSLFDDTEVTQFALKTFKKSLVDNTTIHPDIKGTIYALAVWSDNTHYETVLTHYRETTMQEDKAKFLSALGNSKNKQLLHETLAFCLTPEVRFAHILYVIAGISRNPHGRDIVIDWLIANWDTLLHSGTGMYMIIRHMLKITIPVCGINKEKTVQTFIAKQHIPALEKTFVQIQEELAINSAFVKKNQK